MTLPPHRIATTLLLAMSLVAAAPAVAKQRMRVVVAGISATEGITYSGAIATLTGVPSGFTAANITASIIWGDGSTTPGTVAAADSGSFSVSGSHVYTESGHYTVRVLARVKRNSARGVGSAAVAEVGLLAFGRTFGASPAYDDTSNFINQLYRDLFGREVDPDALAFWFDALISGAVDFETLPLALQTSSEGRNDFIAGLYRMYLHRAPDAGGQGFFVQALADGATIEQVKSLFLSSDEYFFNRAGGQNGGFIIAVYADVLGRTPDAQGMAFFMNTLQQGATRAQVAAAILTSIEARNDLVRSWFEIFLNRQPENAELTAFTQALAGGARYEVVMATIFSTDDYLAQALGSPISGDDFTAVAATFTDANLSAPPNGYSATIDWGDGETTKGTVVRNLFGEYNVRGTHTYHAGGDFKLLVTVHDGGTGLATANGAAKAY